METSPKTVTIYGRLSFPTFTAQEAYDRSQRGQYPAKDIASAKPDFQLLVSQAQWDRFFKAATENFLPYCAEQFKKGEKKDALEPKEVKLLIEGITGPLEDQVYNSPAKPVGEKSAALAPEAVAIIKCIGPTGGNIDLRAGIKDESELKIPDPDILDYPKVVPLELTKHTMYPGAYVAATLNLYAYRNGKLPGFSAGVTTAVFRGDAPQFGGSIDVDESEIFMD